MEDGVRTTQEQLSTNPGMDVDRTTQEQLSTNPLREVLNLALTRHQTKKETEY